MVGADKIVHATTHTNLTDAATSAAVLQKHTLLKIMIMPTLPPIPIPISEMQIMAEAIAQSGLFGLKTPTQALALGLLCQAEGRHPAEAARDYHIIQGRPTLKADAMLARFQQAGGRVEWARYDDEAVVGVFTHPSGGKLTLEWTIERAKVAGLANKDLWKAYPRNMLRSRVISEAIRTIYPGVLSGCYLEDEIDAAPIQVASTSVQAVSTVAQVIALPAPEFPLDAFIAQIQNSETMDDLRKVWTEALQKLPNQEELAKLTTAKDTKKEQLSK